MECPFCYTNFEYHLSICTSCGKDTDDPIYQELFSRVKPRKIEDKPVAAPIGTAEVTETATSADAIATSFARTSGTSEATIENTSESSAYKITASVSDTPLPANTAAVPARREKPAVTSEIRSNDTCKTLVDFPGKKPELPQWRQELQSRVKEIQEQRNSEVQAETKTLVAKRHAIGGTGLAMAVLETPEPVRKSPLVEKALARIERSRANNEEPQEQKPYQPLQSLHSPQPSPYSRQTFQPRASSPEPVQFAKKPIDVSTLPEPEPGIRPFIYSENETVEDRLSKIGENYAERLAYATEMKNDLLAKEQFTTAKLRRPQVSSFYTNTHTTIAEEDETLRVEISRSPDGVQRVQNVKAVILEEDIPAENSSEEEMEEIAPFVFRFNAGFFDLIISSFLSLLLLSPFIAVGGNWFTFEGTLAFAATCSIVMFLYITASIGMIGRTLGMSLFSLEMIDAADSDYPTFNQAAVSSSIYLISLALGGIGFATMFWNEDRRAFHDLVSGTVVIREN